MFEIELHPAIEKILKLIDEIEKIDPKLLEGRVPEIHFRLLEYDDLFEKFNKLTDAMLAEKKLDVDIFRITVPSRNFLTQLNNILETLSSDETYLYVHPSHKYGSSKTHTFLFLKELLERPEDALSRASFRRDRLREYRKMLEHIQIYSARTLNDSIKGIDKLIRRLERDYRELRVVYYDPLEAIEKLSIGSVKKALENLFGEYDVIILDDLDLVLKEGKAIKMTSTTLARAIRKYSREKRRNLIIAYNSPDDIKSSINELKKEFEQRVSQGSYTYLATLEAVNLMYLYVLVDRYGVNLRELEVKEALKKVGRDLEERTLIIPYTDPQRLRGAGSLRGLLRQALFNIALLIRKRYEGLYIAHYSNVIPGRVDEIEYEKLSLLHKNIFSSIESDKFGVKLVLQVLLNRAIEGMIRKASEEKISVEEIKNSILFVYGNNPEMALSEKEIVDILRAIKVEGIKKEGDEITLNIPKLTEDYEKLVKEAIGNRDKLLKHLASRISKKIKNDLERRLSVAIFIDGKRIPVRPKVDAKIEPNDVEEFYEDLVETKVDMLECMREVVSMAVRMVRRKEEKDAIRAVVEAIGKSSCFELAILKAIKKASKRIYITLTFEGFKIKLNFSAKEEDYDVLLDNLKELAKEKAEKAMIKIKNVLSKSIEIDDREDFYIINIDVSSIKGLEKEGIGIEDRNRINEYINETISSKLGEALKKDSICFYIGKKNTTKSCREKIEIKLEDSGERLTIVIVSEEDLLDYITEEVYDVVKEKVYIKSSELIETLLKRFLKRLGINVETIRFHKVLYNGLSRALEKYEGEILAISSKGYLKLEDDLKDAVLIYADPSNEKLIEYILERIRDKIKEATILSTEDLSEKIKEKLKLSFSFNGYLEEIVDAIYEKLVSENYFGNLIVYHIDQSYSKVDEIMLAKLVEDIIKKVKAEEANAEELLRKALEKLPPMNLKKKGIYREGDVEKILEKLLKIEAVRKVVEKIDKEMKKRYIDERVKSSLKKDVIEGLKEISVPVKISIKLELEIPEGMHQEVAEILEELKSLEGLSLKIETENIEVK